MTISASEDGKANSSSEALWHDGNRKREAALWPEDTAQVTVSAIAKLIRDATRRTIERLLDQHKNVLPVNPETKVPKYLWEEIRNIDELAHTITEMNSGNHTLASVDLNTGDVKVYGWNCVDLRLFCSQRANFDKSGDATRAIQNIKKILKPVGRANVRSLPVYVYDRKEVLDYFERQSAGYEPAVNAAYDKTDAAPGSHEKIRILVSRFASGAPLWNPKDRRNYEG